MVIRVAINNNAKKREEALAAAEKKLTLEGHTPTVRLKPNEISTLPEIFQPREFTFGLRPVDGLHVKALQREIGIHGELDPPCVIKLKRTGWVVTAGHHRIEAYKAEGKGDEEITCQWFKGTVQAAAKDAMKENNKVKLNVKQADRMEEAWKQVLLKWGSKREIAEWCSVSPSQVAIMRRAVQTVQAQNPKGEEFRKRLSVGYYSPPLKETATPAEALEHLKTLSWGVAGAYFRGATKEEHDEDAAVMRLVRILQNRLEDELSKNSPRIFARALRLYDPSLPPQLITAWKKDGDDDYDGGEPYLEKGTDDDAPDAIPL
jgi:hypothetical protein